MLRTMGRVVRIFGLKWEKIAGGWREFYSSTNIIEIEIKEVGWDGWDQKFVRNFGSKALREEICMDGTIVLKCNLRNRVELCAMDLSDSG